MRRGLRIGFLLVLAALGAATAFGLTTASAHTDPCHTRHECPSDHHTYVWFDASGQGWDCARPGASELTAADTTLVTYAGLPYYCHAAGAAPPPPTTTTATTTAAPATATPTPTATPKPGVVNVGRTVKLAAHSRSAACRRGVLPDRRCSPGAIYSGLTTAVLCSSTFRTASIRNVPDSEKRQVEVAYGMAPRAYGRTIEIDHIVSLELGGSNDISNLYPEPGSGPANYHSKDKLENKLHKMVCDGEINLASAQRRIATNWISLYTSVFGERP